MIQNSINDHFQRSKALLGEEFIDKLHNSRAMIFGIGGVGSYALEAVARADVGNIIIVDNDVVAPSNINRQLIALSSNIGESKVDVALRRVKDINPDADVKAIKAFYLPDSPVEIPDNVNIVLDCIDTVSAKLHIMETCAKKNIALISCMGMGNRYNPQLIKIGKLNKTSGDPLCKVLRRETKKRGISNITVVYSTEEAAKPGLIVDGKPSPASLPYVPSVGGLYMAYMACEALGGRQDILNFIPKKEGAL
ncbi:MAG: tRNA threonylcarbamoyladenosine dehydratase [Christensenellaceae bacterium]|nr:tRNA threonylcarbamoyladenosine dehydratase [Christensenellaceae bacterium]